MISCNAISKSILGLAFGCTFVGGHLCNGNPCLTALSGLVCAVAFPLLLKITPCKISSQFDATRTIDADNWAVTLIKSGRSSKKDHKNVGHAQIVIEGVYNNNKVTSIADFVQIGEESEVRLQTFYGDFKIKSNERSNTWKKEADMVIGLIYFISIRSKDPLPSFVKKNNPSVKRQIEFLKIVWSEEDDWKTYKCPPPPFCISGNSSLLAKCYPSTVEFTHPLTGESHTVTADEPHNCTTWAREMLQAIKIDLPEEGFFYTAPDDYMIKS